ncbi:MULTISPECIES: DUF6241 domain-containing protein [Clostridium]|uniref:Uncharacterized protein n=1 Tax=Clostridium disporicum TaxID=84024 RepID=A0A174AAT8_9CLOT|nr:MULTISPECIES: DUF6241 domain-containing protein [Clostridium]CUN85772.1 Uncharacterised protein [Clostridium disporicum]
MGKDEMENKDKEKIEEFKTVDAKEYENDYEEDEDEDEDDYEEGSSKAKKAIIIIIVLILSLSTVAVLWANGYEIVNFALNKVSESKNEVEIQEENVDNTEENITAEAVDINTIYDMIHRMANTIIIAEDGNIWGKDEITEDNIDKVLYQLNGRDEYLDTELKKWKGLDFSNGVEVHNYVWTKLGGTIGKAKSLDEQSIETIVNSLSE